MIKFKKEENQEFIILEETIPDTQKKIKQWLSIGYEITFINQLSREHSNGVTLLITTLIRSKN